MHNELKSVNFIIISSMQIPHHKICEKKKKYTYMHRHDTFIIQRFILTTSANFNWTSKNSKFFSVEFYTIFQKKVESTNPMGPIAAQWWVWWYSSACRGSSSLLEISLNFCDTNGYGNNSVLSISNWLICNFKLTLNKDFVSVTANRKNFKR